VTKETKLALIIGFALILVVGVLVSDHLSEARKARPADIGGLAQQTGPFPPLAGATRQIADPTDPYGQRHSAAPVDRGRGVIPGGDDWAGIVDPARAQRGDVPPGGAITPTQTHVVGAGETLRSLALRYLGAPEYWDEIQILNVDLLGAGGTEIQPGMRLRVPIAQVDTARSRAESRTQQAQQQAQQQSQQQTSQQTPQQTTPQQTRREDTTPRQAPQPGEKIYVVKQNDSLWSIAASELGNGARWQELVKANADTLKNPDLLRPGMRLVIPKR